MDFKEKVFDKIRKIPKDRVSTYKEVAKVLNKPKAYRAVGNALNRNVSKKVPCHRVIRSDGFVGGFNKGNNKKVKKLKLEGVKVSRGKIDLDKYLYKF